ncbi:hypothetical protein IPL85_00830 [Candidatus Saccharibacteria bacterium]|nr:MAG: hypothetical protein IPL85_00830 [Candidatus Saccharibacteria bacterium]
MADTFSERIEALRIQKRDDSRARAQKQVSAAAIQLAENARVAEESKKLIADLLTFLTARDVPTARFVRTDSEQVILHSRNILKPWNPPTYGTRATERDVARGWYISDVDGEPGEWDVSYHPSTPYGLDTFGRLYRLNGIAPDRYIGDKYAVMEEILDPEMQVRILNGEATINRLEELSRGN